MAQDGLLSVEWPVVMVPAVVAGLLSVSDARMMMTGAALRCCGVW